MDDFTFKQLKESMYQYPILTEVMFDYNMMLEMVFHSMTIIEKGYDTVWDTNMLNFIYTYFREGVKFIEKLIREKGIKVRIIIQTTKNNIDIVKSMKYYEVRCLEDIKGNLGIFDNRAYMVYIFHRDSDKPDQTLWSNSKALVEKQQALFEKLWEAAIPISIRVKEIEFEDDSESPRTFTDFNKIQGEFRSLIQTSKNELSIYSSVRILRIITNNHRFENYFASLLDKRITVKILTDNIDKTLIEQVKSINNKYENNLVQLGYSDRLGSLDELILISDSKYVLSIRDDNNNDLVAKFSKDEHYVHVQEILFEKYWNEISSLSALNNQ